MSKLIYDIVGKRPLARGPAWLVLPGTLGLAVGVSLLVGSHRVPWSELVAWLGGGLEPVLRDRLDNLFFAIRLPRILAGVVIGAALATSGAAFQALFVNPLVSPGLLGVLAGASFGAALGILLSWSLVWVQALAFVFGLVAVALALLLVRGRGGRSRVMLVLGGIISGAFFTALLSMVKYVADPENQLPSIVYFLMGSLAQVDLRTALWAGAVMLAGTAGLIVHGQQLNALSMGEDEAHCLGVRVERVQMVIVVLATLVGALSVVVGGVIGWVGLIVPHLARLLCGPDNTRLLPTSAVLGALYLLVLDDIGRTFFPVEIPIGVLTALCGIPCFAILFRRAGGGWR
jgi:iron complex transport system permease protein